MRVVFDGIERLKQEKPHFMITCGVVGLALQFCITTYVGLIN
jgi:hypothetical protein